MNTMKGFYASISSAAQLTSSYLQALSEITGISHQQAKTLQSDLGWQDWGEENQKAVMQRI
jgi:hypothetical protein